MAEPLDHEVVVVPELTVHAVTGETCYAGENGFSALWAEVTTTDRTLIEVLAPAEGTTRVLLRCAMLDVTGRMTNVERTQQGTRFVFSVEDLVHRNPKPAGNVV